MQCLRCKGRGHCGRGLCPIQARAQAHFKVNELLPKQEFSGRSPSAFVGSAYYPHVNVGILSPPERLENAWEFDAPRHWAEQTYQIPRIIDFRSTLINSRIRCNIKDRNRFIDIAQEVGMASKPVDIEISLESRPKFSVGFDSQLAPTGPSARLKTVKITSNPKVPGAVEKATSDTDLKAKDAVQTLFDLGIDENYLTRLLSLGTLGMHNQRKLVPTRWSITAVDDTLGKKYLEDIRQYDLMEHRFYSSQYLGNHYFIMTFPENWSFELFETYLAKASWNQTEKAQYSTDYEGYNSRTDYAESCAGGYYAARLAATELLHEAKRQASCLVLRFITPEYSAPLGVWVCREACRKAARNRPINFDDRQTMLKYCAALSKRKFGYDATEILQKSIVLKNIRQQKRLIEY